MANRKKSSHEDFGGLLAKNLGTPASGGDATNKTYVDAGDTSAKSRANHTGTQLASTVSDFDSQVRTSRLDQMAAPTSPVAFGGQRQTNIADPTGAQDSATKNYVDVALAGLAAGLIIKGSVRAVHSSSNVNISSPGSTLDGLTPSAGEVFILTAQTTGSENGPWTWNGAASAMTRPANFDTSAEAVLGSFWVVREGTSADAHAIMTNDTTVTLGTTSLAFVVRGLSGGTSGFAQDIPAISAGGSTTITHNLGTRDVTVVVYRNSSPWDDVDVYTDRPTTNTVTIQPDVAYSNAEYRVGIRKIV